MRLAVFALASACLALACLSADPALASKASEAEAAFSEARDQDAIALYGQMIAETAGDPSAQAQAYFSRGEVYAVTARAELAIADFTTALGLPQDRESRANTFFSRGEAQNRQRRFEAALADYSEALKLQPAMLGVHFASGRTLRVLKRDDEALKEFDAELKLNPESYRGQSARAELLGLPQPHLSHPLLGAK